MAPGAGPSPRAWGLLARPAWERRPHLGPSPRAWGLRAADSERTWSRPGPSPRAWGLLAGFCRIGASTRSIPTCVGTTPCAVPVAEVPAGPSPRAWGLRTGPGPRGRASPVHPHVRGDYARPSGRSWQSRRSIPTCVGTTCHDLATWSHVARSIPTCVGTTPGATSSSGVARSIPTCVGTTAAAVLARRRPGGPSPRAWGLRGSTFAGTRSAMRSIPTCVGTTGRA